MSKPTPLLLAPMLFLLAAGGAGARASAAGAYAPRPALDSGHYLQALAEAQAQLQTHPQDALALAARSQALTALMRFPEALASADRALALQPGLAEGFLSRGLARAGMAVAARNFSSLRSASGALDDLQAATRMDPTLTTAWMTLGLAYEQLPGILGGSTRKALACAESLRRANPGKVDQARADVLQGTILAMEGKWTEALPFFGRALAGAPGEPALVVAYLDAHGSRETREVLGDAECKRRLGSEARRLLGQVRQSGRGVEAVCEALLDADAAEEAWRTAQEGLDRVDAPSLLRLELGKIAARSGLHREEGLAFLDRVVREPLEGGSGGHPAAHWRRGQILRALGRNGEARAAAQEALRLDPRHTGARRLLKDLG
jgi:tetratricopeptide (TPR) repeat protein